MGHSISFLHLVLIAHRLIQRESFDAAGAAGAAGVGAPSTTFLHPQTDLNIFAMAYQVLKQQYILTTYPFYNISYFFHK
jgi:hypothetical protein